MWSSCATTALYRAVTTAPYRAVTTAHYRVDVMVWYFSFPAVG